MTLQGRRNLRLHDEEIRVLTVLCDERWHLVHGDLTLLTGMRYALVLRVLTRLIVAGDVDDDWEAGSAESNPRRLYRATSAGLQRVKSRPQPRVREITPLEKFAKTWTNSAKIWTNRVSQVATHAVGEDISVSSDVEDPPLIAAHETMDVYVRKLNVFTAGLRTEEVAPGVVLDWHMDKDGVKQLAGVEVLTVKGVEIDGIREVRPTVRRR